MDGRRGSGDHPARQRQEAVILIGIDWGTHSSKSAYSRYGIIEFGDVVSSNLHSDGENIMLDPRGGIIGFKRAVITDPKLDWRQPHQQTGIAYGATVTFVLCSLIRSLLVRCTGNDLSAASLAHVMPGAEFRFSFPNWVGDEMRPAFNNFRESAILAVSMVLKDPECVSAMRAPNHAKRFEQAYEAARAEQAVGVRDNENPMDVIDVLKVGGNTILVRYVMESVAAGLPTLKQMEKKMQAGSRDKRYRKILVYDVGAGSTDVGYMVLYRESDSEDFYFVYFPPCEQIALGGNWLTDRLWERIGKEENSFVLAERRKEQLGPDSFPVEIPEVAQWLDGIALPSAQYVGKLPPHVHMHQNILTEVILTGGSSLVPGLAEILRQHVPDALTIALNNHTQRTLDFPLAARSARIFEEILPEFQRDPDDPDAEAKGPVEQARRAVVHGLCLPLNRLITYAGVPNKYFRCDGGCADPGRGIEGSSEQFLGRY